MNDASPLKIQSELLLTPSAVLAPVAPASLNGFSPAPPDIVDDEESSVIKCICGFNDDDGSTVFCEECQTWQHIECYYPKADGAAAFDIPEVHECTDCRPRYLDVNGARERQAQNRLLYASKAKRALSKGQKRRIKEPHQANGFRAADGRDRASDSPRDQPPPAKRPKTNHKSSSSHSINQPVSHHRRRTGSTVTGRSPVKRLSSPSLPCPPYFSAEFMQLYKKDQYTPIHANSYASIAVSNNLSSWLTDPESLIKVTSKSHHEIFQRWDRPIEELEATSPGYNTYISEDRDITIDGVHPAYRGVTVDKDIGPGSYIGELKGQIGLKQDYIENESNRWAKLRHPAPFVFFLDTLPLYIDSRSEGTDLRYIRRSCTPNVKIQIVVLGTEYHFCLVSIKDIPGGEELSLGWTLDDKPFRIVRDWNLNGTMSEQDEAYMCNWTGTVLANFGGCTCGRSNACLLWRFDRRAHPNAPVTAEKPAKPKKGRKPGTQISPLSTGKATNSRAGSEAIINGDIDDDAIETRSVSASSRSKHTSRDNTPTVGFGIEMSDRERRKILQQERLFEQLEQEEQHGGKKKKRNSAGSALNTPSANASVMQTLTLRPQTSLNRMQKQLGFAESSNPSPTGSNTARPRVNGVVQNNKPSDPSTAPGVDALPRTKPVYVDASTQTEEPKLTPEVAAHVAKLRKGRGGPTQRLWKRIEDERRRLAQRRLERQKSLASSSPTSSHGELLVAKEAATSMPPPPLPVSVQGTRSVSPPPVQHTGAETEDVEMTDAVKEEEDAPSSAMDGVAHTAVEALPDVSAPEQPRPPPPPWAPEAATPVPESPTKAPVPKTPDLHIQLPPPPNLSAQAFAQTPTTPSVAGTPGSISGSLMAQSPAPVSANAPLFSPSVSSVMQQSSPAKPVKRLSLGDYLRRRQERAAAATAASDSGSVLAVSSPPCMNSHPQQPPSLPTSSSSVIEEADMAIPPPRLQAGDIENRNSEPHAETAASA